MPCPCTADNCGCGKDCLQTGTCTCDASCDHCSKTTQGCGKEGCKCEDCKCTPGECSCEKSS